jgi:hypothetical protein
MSPIEPASIQNNNNLQRTALMESENPTEQEQQQQQQPTPLVPNIRSTRRRNGNVAKLPKATRHKINTMIDDGVTYHDIIARLGDEAQGINEEHLSRWRTNGGFHDWLKEQQKVELLEQKRDFAFDVLQKQNGSQIPQTVLQLIATNLCELLVELEPAGLKQSLLSDSDKFSRFVSSMVKLAEGEIKCEQHQAVMQDRAATAKRTASGEKPGVSEESLRAAEQKLRLL